MKLEEKKIPRIPGPTPRPVKRSGLTSIGKAFKSFRLLLDNNNNKIMGIFIFALYGALALITYERINGVPLRGEKIESLFHLLKLKS